MSNPEAPIIDIHMPAIRGEVAEGTYVDPRLNKYGRSELILALLQQGAEVVLSREPDAFDVEADTAQLLRPVVHGVLPSSDIEVTPFRGQLSQIGAIRNTARVLDERLPQLNHPAVRAVGRDPLQLQAVFAAAEVDMDYAVWEGAAGTPVDSALYAIADDHVRLMRGHGKGRQVYTGTKASIRDRVESGEIDAGQNWAVDTLVDLTRPWPELTGSDLIENERLKRVVQNGGAYALRAYVFGDDNGQPITSYAMRSNPDAPKSEASDLIALRQDSVPGEARDLTTNILQQLKAETGVEEIHMAVDYGLTSAGAVVPVGAVMAEPRLVEHAVHPELAMEQARLLAAQLIRMASARS